MSLRLSSRAALGANTSNFAREVARLGHQALDLTLSNPSAAGLGWTDAELQGALNTCTPSRYVPHAMGMPAAREAVVRSLGLPLSDAERTMLTASTSEAYAFLFKLLADPGDEVLVPSPSYPLFDYLARYEGLTAVPYPMVYDGLWHVDLSALRSRIGPRTRAIVVVSPNNPTGSLLSREEFFELDGLGLPILADEVFTDYVLHPRADSVRPSDFAQAQSAWFVMGGMSKSCALPQWKLAWTVLRGQKSDQTDLMWDSLETIADTYLSVSTIAQQAVESLLSGAPRVRARICDRLQQNLSIVDAELRGSAANRLRVEGGWSCILQLPDLLDDETWAYQLLREQRVLVQPGYFYELGPAPYLVLSLLTPPEVMREGVCRIVQQVDAVSRQ